MTNRDLVIGKPKTAANLYDLRLENNRYFFKIRGEGEAFWDAIRLLKNSIRPKEREWNNQEKVWRIKATFINKVKLCEIFQNAQASFTYLEAQMKMF